MKNKNLRSLKCKSMLIISITFNFNIESHTHFPRKCLKMLIFWKNDLLGKKWNFLNFIYRIYCEKNKYQRIKRNSPRCTFPRF